jgi:hypothetical protein
MCSVMIPQKPGTSANAVPTVSVTIIACRQLTCLLGVAFNVCMQMGYVKFLHCI